MTRNSAASTGGSTNSCGVRAYCRTVRRAGAVGCVRLGGTSGQVEKHLVERGPAQPYVLDVDAALVKETADCGQLVGSAIGGHGSGRGIEVHTRRLGCPRSQHVLDSREIGSGSGSHLDDVAASQILEFPRSTGRDGVTVVDDHDVPGQLIGLL